MNHRRLAPAPLPEAVIEHGIASGSQGLFPPKGEMGPVRRTGKREEL